MTAQQFISMTQQEHFRLRECGYNTHYGAVFMAQLRLWRPELERQITGTSKDCYYHDRMVSPVKDFITKNWEVQHG